MRSAMDILQRIRELGVEGANGTLDSAQMGYIGDEVNQLLDELVTIANSKDQSGNYLFSGSLARTQPFRAIQGRVPGGAADMVVSVDYLGNADPGTAEISEGAQVAMNLPGNSAFWAEQQQIYSTVDSRTYRVQASSTIRIDGASIPLFPGDTAAAVAAKINDANAPVKAGIDSVTGGLVLSTTVAHQIRAEDMGGGTVLQDLGILAPGGSHPPLNVSPSAGLTSMVNVLVSAGTREKADASVTVPVPLLKPVMTRAWPDAGPLVITKLAPFSGGEPMSAAESNLRNPTVPT